MTPKDAPIVGKVLPKLSCKPSTAHHQSHSLSRLPAPQGLLLFFSDASTAVFFPLSSNIHLFCFSLLILPHACFVEPCQASYSLGDPVDAHTQVLSYPQDAGQPNQKADPSQCLETLQAQVTLFSLLSPIIIPLGTSLRPISPSRPAARPYLDETCINEKHHRPFCFRYVFQGA